MASEHEEEISMPQHLFEHVSSFIGTSDAKSKLAVAKSILPYVGEIDGYLSFSESGSEGQLPVLEWNAHLRKAYTLLLWVRPVLGGEMETTIAEDDEAQTSRKRILYRFSTSHGDQGLGVCVSVGDWRVVKQKDTSNRTVQTTLTAFSLPFLPPGLFQSSDESEATPYVSAPLDLIENEWSMIGITHVFPYLKRPHWTLCVNGRVTATGELLYPVLDKTPIMSFNTLFQNIVSGGAMVLDEDVVTPDHKKTASELQSTVYPRLKLSLHLASFCLCNDILSSTIQALLAQAGPALTLQNNGALPILPPVANWTKGSSLEGPNVGIPLVVHGQALQLQQVASSCVLWGSAIEARLLGVDGRIVCRMPHQLGTTHNVPRVGLVEPTPPSPQNHRSAEPTDSDFPISLTIVGACSLHHNLSDYLLHSPNVTNVDTQLFHCTKHFSLLMEGTNLDSQLILPFFLSLPPPGTIWDLQDSLYQASLHHLYALYTNEGELGACLLDVFSASLSTGGGRWHEQILQNGSLHVLACSLRQSLVRAEALGVHKYATCAEFVQAHSNSSTSLSMASLPISPTRIPISIAKACASLLGACCGPRSPLLEDLSPAMQIQRTSDMALTALFGIALDFEIWGRDLASCAVLMEAVDERYGGPCVTAGYIVRSQVSVQYFLDLIKNQLDRDSPSILLERVANACASILQAMLLSSLSNNRSISQGEHDVSACMGALSDSPLGSVGGHVIFTALVGVLRWSEVFPNNQKRTGRDEEHKMQVANRLGRNLMISQFHDVVAPMLLSRTVFCGERTMTGEADEQDTSYVGALSWQEHWRLGLLTFSWVASIAGPEGVLASKSLGSLLLASGLAGSLKGALDAAGIDTLALVSSLFLPPPALALNMVVTSRKDEWSYTDLLSDRLQVMIPLLPGMVVSILSHPSDVTADTTISKEALNVLSELVTAVGGSFYRVFGGMTHSTASRSSGARQRTMVTEIVKAAKDFIPHLLVVAMILENHIELRKRNRKDEQGAVKILPAPQITDQTKRSDDDSWVEVSSVVNESFSHGAVVIPEGARNSGSVEVLLVTLQACQKSIAVTISELMTNAMGAGGGEASTLLWRRVLLTLRESVTYATRDNKEDSSEMDDESGSSGTTDRNSKAEALAHNVLCRLAASVLVKSLKRDHRWEVWMPEISSAVSRLCLLVEEKELLLKPLGKESTDGRRLYTEDQILLLCAMLDVLKYGRDMSGWCQLILPSPPVPSLWNQTRKGKDEDSKTAPQNGPPGDAIHGASKLLLPVLQPCLRVVVECIGNLSSDINILIPSTVQKSLEVGSDKAASEAGREESLLNHVMAELSYTSTAAIVGMSFPNARDVALQAMASLRRAKLCFKNAGDETGSSLCGSLLCTVAEEIRVRYEGERRRRETALFDAYDDDEGQKKDVDRSAREAAAANAHVIENLILGGELIPSKEDDVEKSFNPEVEEVTFGQDSDADAEGLVSETKKTDGSEDFVLFHEAYADGSGRTAEESRAKMEWSRYEGLGKQLEECCKAEKGREPRVDSVLAILTPYLDAWDESAAQEAAESELVELFDFNLSATLFGDGSPDSDHSTDLQQLPILGSDTAADAMTTFIEFAAVEKSRLAEVTENFLPNHRNSCIAFAERFCWARHMEISRESGEAGMDQLWERGIADGNRDIRSRLVSIPCNPQFKRYIPKYLDHGAAHDKLRQSESEDAPSQDDEDRLQRKTEASTSEMDTFTKTLLETGHLEIVDITKKEQVEDYEPELVLPTGSSLDDDAMFGEAPMEAPAHPREEAPISKKDEATESESSRMWSADVEVTAEDTNQQESSRIVFDKTKLGSSHFNITASAFASPPDNSSSTLSLIHSAAANMIEQHVENCLHVKAEGSRKCSLLLTSTHLILEYDPETEGLYEGEMMAVREEAERQKMIEGAGGRINPGDKDRIQNELEKRQRETASLRPKSIRWNLSELSHVYLRRYRLRDSSLEMFFIPSGGTSFGGYGLYSPSTSLFLDFGPGYEGNTKRDEASFAIMKRAPPQAIKQWPDRGAQFLHEQLSRLALGWVEGRITNFDYLLHLNMLSGRSYNDICQYPVMPWVLADYKSEEIPDLLDRKNFRDLTKPMGALNPSRLEDFIERFSTFADPFIPPFMYGSHYSTSAGVVLHFLVRLHPFAGLHRQLQGGHFDVADRLFSSVPRTWEMCTGSSAAEVKELTPEWYSNPTFLKNTNNFKLGTSQEGDMLCDVALPPWAKGKPETFVEVMRNALESDICSEMLPDWIDLIFGRKQQGPEAIAAHNVFFYLTYYGSVDVASIEDDSLRQATELQIAHFGQCPMQLFVRPHVRRVQMQNYRRLSFYQILSAYTNGAARDSEEKDRVDTLNRVFGKPLYLPFFSAPISHWVHLDAPPPGPHANLIGVRFAGTDRCLAVDAQGVFHCFRWAWKAEEDRAVDGTAWNSTFQLDDGCFIAQRELPRFRTVPRLVHTPRPDEVPAVAISKTLFAGRSLLLVLSDGDGRGSMAMQLVDPAKGSIRGEAVVNAVHSAQITCIATDPIGTAAGHGGVGGELAIVGSLDGCASIWRFMSSHYLPLRPRVRLGGHGGAKISGVSLSASIHIAATVSSHRCCLHSIGNGSLIRIIDPPRDTLDLPESNEIEVETVFADTPALAISVQGFVVTVCETRLKSPTSPSFNRSIITLHLFSLEGVSLGSKPLEMWRGIPHKMSCTPDGTAVLVCSGRGVTIHRVSAITPLEFIDEWHITETDELNSSVAHVWDVDLGPSLNRPVVAAAACSDGALRLHALAGISSYSQRHGRVGFTTTVGSALARPARRIRNAFSKGVGVGSKVVGVGKDIGKEVTTDVKERGVTGFLGGMFSRKSSN
jgi:hypothetical protein